MTSALDVPLDSIRAAFQGVIPSPVATASPDGVPNCTYLSVVWYVDDERIAISNQFLGKTAANLRANPLMVLRVVDPTTMTEYELEATFLRSDSSGELFEGVRAQLEAVAAQTGQEDVFRLRSIEILRVDRCSPAGRPTGAARSKVDPGELLSSLDIFGRRLAECRDLAEATRVALQTLEDLFAFPRSMLFLADPAQRHLFAVAINGYPAGGIGAEIPIGEGAVGVAAHRRRQVRLANVERLSRAGATDAETESAVVLSGSEDAQSVLATPLLLHDELLGVLYLDSDRPAAFDADDARLAEVLAGHLALTVSLLEEGGLEPLVPRQPMETLPASTDEVLVAFYDHDGTVLVDGDYVIKGVPGRILFAMLSEHSRSGRNQFTNRELRLDRSIGLPAGKDNLEARLLALRRRLAERDDPFRIERVGRGQLELFVDAQLSLERHDA